MTYYYILIIIPGCYGGPVILHWIKNNNILININISQGYASGGNSISHTSRARQVDECNSCRCMPVFVAKVYLNILADGISS